MLIVDTDEVVVPLIDDNWQEMIKRVIQNIRTIPSAISIHNVFKFPPKNKTRNERNSFFDNKFRTQKIQSKELYGKSFIKSEYITFAVALFLL